MTPDQQARLREFSRRVLHLAINEGNSDIWAWGQELGLVETRIATEADLEDAKEDGFEVNYSAGDEIEAVVAWLVDADEDEEVGA